MDITVGYGSPAVMWKSSKYGNGDLLCKLIRSSDNLFNRR